MQYLTYRSLFSAAAVFIDFSSATYTASEGDGFANVSLELTGTAERAVTVRMHTEDGMATGMLGD